jgi:uncharacterized membrane protein YhiD involved in acid resistance
MTGRLLDDDPSARGRIASYVVSGFGFFGAGVIFKDSGNIRGLNTAATIWCSAAIGVLAGFGAPHLSLLLALAVIFTNTVLLWTEIILILDASRKIEMVSRTIFPQAHLPEQAATLTQRCYIAWPQSLVG